MIKNILLGKGKVCCGFTFVSASIGINVGIVCLHSNNTFPKVGYISYNLNVAIAMVPFCRVEWNHFCHLESFMLFSLPLLSLLFVFKLQLKMCAAKLLFFTAIWTHTHFSGPWGCLGWAQTPQIVSSVLLQLEAIWWNTWNIETSHCARYSAWITQNSSVQQTSRPNDEEFSTQVCWTWSTFGEIFSRCQKLSAKFLWTLGAILVEHTEHSDVQVKIRHFVRIFSGPWGHLVECREYSLFFHSFCA